LIERCLAGDESAYAALYDRYASIIYRLCIGLLQHKEDAEEVLQDSFEYAFRKLASYNPRKSAFKSWLYQIAVSRCRNKRRRRLLPSFSLSRLAERDAADREAPSLDDLSILNDRQRLIWGALAKLSPKLRETAVLRYYESLSYAEIGTLLKIPAKTAESRMRLAHRALRDLLSESD
jgi:RNA polymerase sigma-70 factor (ECF subfamily)